MDISNCRNRRNQLVQFLKISKAPKSQKTGLKLLTHPPQQSHNKLMKLNIRLLYLYLFSFVGLVVTVTGAIRIIELGLNVYVFKGADQYEYARPIMAPDEEMKISTEEAKMQEEEQKQIQERQTTRQRQREAAGALAMLIVGFPLYKYHWSVIQKENKKD